MYKKFTIMVHRDAKMLIVAQYDKDGSLVSKGNVAVREFERQQPPRNWQVYALAIIPVALIIGLAVAMYFDAYWYALVLLGLTLVGLLFKKRK